MKLATLAALLAASLATGQPTKILVTPGTGPIGIQKMLGGPMKGAPYSATIVTETIQTLADGNRITQRMTGSVARDSEGRMRHETILPTIGGLAVAGKAPHLVFILDPVSQTNYTIDLNARTVRKTNVIPQAEAEAKQAFEKQRMEKRLTMREHQLPENAEHIRQHIGQPHIGEERLGSAEKERAESLGFQTIEGIAAEGTRRVRTIPAGEIGNEKPIEITSEIWISPDLKAVVLSRTSDPRTGEQIYRLTNIQRTEPAALLFIPPADFQQVESGKSVIEYKSRD